MTTKAQPKRLVIELPVCPVEGCETVGKLPGSSWQGKPYCLGSKNFRHAKKAMETRKFKEVR